MEDFDRAIARLPRWILMLAGVGSVVAGFSFGIAVAGGFLIGALGAYLNLWVIERAANRVARLAQESTAPHESSKPGGGAGAWVFVQFSGLLLGALVILNVSGFSSVAAFWGLMVCPAAVILEIVYELVTLKL
jgi:hypothetical protein